ncbi:PilW family protein [Dokdonella soli]|uniref:Pilus assembly protein PilW n=1 Tax=Dokdonella soli TaxID=529810 RepID=A0ABP3TI21_9GAMM
MIALVLGLLLIEGVLVLFSETSRVNARQTALFRLQDKGRIALGLIADDLRLAGRLPCGSRIRPLVFADALADHIVGTPAAANVPQGWPAATPYPLDRGIFISGNRCIGNACTPALASAQGLPPAGLAEGDRIPGTDMLTVRHLQGSGWAARADDPGSLCKDNKSVGPITIRKLPGDSLPAGFDASHVALLANCSNGEILAVAPHADTLQPIQGNFGAAACMAIDAQTRVFDLDAQLQTSVYYLAMKARAGVRDRGTAVLMRRMNGVTSEVVEGVERLDFRYSLVDSVGTAHWLTAAEVDHATASDGAQLQCGMSDGTVTRPCAWSDIDAVDISMLINTVEDLPADSSAHAFDYRYSVDGDQARPPQATMPVTGLPTGRMLRREFHSVVALGNLGA